MTARKWGLPTWVQNQTTGSSSHSLSFVFILVLLALLTTESKLGCCMCMSAILVFYRSNDAKQPHLGLSPHKSREDTYTWSQRRWRVRIDGRKSRTCARSVRLDSDIRVLSPITGDRGSVPEDIDLSTVYFIYTWITHSIWHWRWVSWLSPQKSWRQSFGPILSCVTKPMLDHLKPKFLAYTCTARSLREF